MLSCVTSRFFLREATELATMRVRLYYKSKNKSDISLFVQILEHMWEQKYFINTIVETFGINLVMTGFKLPGCILIITGRWLCKWYVLFY